MLPLPPSSYEDAVKRFRWDIPARYNIGVDACVKWAEHDPGRLALIHVDQDGQARNYSFGDMHESSNRLANLFLALGAKPGDRIGILLPQAPETAYAHIAAYKIGCIAIPLRSEEHTSEPQSLMGISYACFRLKKKTLLCHLFIATTTLQYNTS